MALGAGKRRYAQLEQVRKAQSADSTRANTRADTRQNNEAAKEQVSADFGPDCGVGKGQKRQKRGSDSSKQKAHWKIAELGDVWSVHWSEEHAHVFYWNSQTRETTWERPVP